MKKFGISLLILAMLQLIVAGIGIFLRSIKIPLFSHELLVTMLWSVIITSAVADVILFIIILREQWKNDVF